MLNFRHLLALLPMRYTLLFLFVLIYITIWAATWGEPWHAAVVKEADRFILGECH